MAAIWKHIRHNSFLISSFVIVLAVLLYTYGCESNVRSLKQPSLRVNRAELILELQNITSEAELRIADLDKQDEFKEAMFNLALIAVEGRTLNPIAVALTLGSFVGFGAVVDNRRKDAVIKTLKKKTS